MVASGHGAEESDALHWASAANGTKVMTALLEASGDVNGRHSGPGSRWSSFEFNAEPDVRPLKAAAWGSALEVAKFFSLPV
jgi:ankyrin repeat protein